MPGMTSIPILSSAQHSASVTSASGTNATPLGTSSASSTTAVNAGNTSTQGNDVSPPAGNTNDSFASILKRQLMQSPANAQPLASELAATVLTGAPVAPTLASDLIAGQPLDAKPLTDPAAPDAKKPLNAELDSLPQDDVARNLALNADPMANAGQPINLIPVSKLPASPLADTASSSDHSAKQNDDISQGTPGNNLAALLAFFPALTPNGSAKPDTALSSTEKKSTPIGAQLLATATPTLIQSNPGKEGNAPPPNLAEASLTTASKAADFAATQALSADAVPAHASNNESTNSETSFENMLAAAQLSSQARSGETHMQPSHASAPMTIQTPVGARGWDGEIGEKLVWMVGRQEQRAELVLNPPQLGRVEISLTMNGDQTNASFVSANPAVRDALETALPRLREMFTDAGISLGQAHVGADSGNNAANQSGNNRENGDNSSRFSNRSDLTLGGNILGQARNSQWLRQGSGLVDIFA